MWVVLAPLTNGVGAQYFDTSRRLLRRSAPTFPVSLWRPPSQLFATDNSLIITENVDNSPDKMLSLKPFINLIAMIFRRWFRNFALAQMILASLDIKLNSRQESLFNLRNWIDIHRPCFNTTWLSVVGRHRRSLLVCSVILNWSQ